MTDKSDFNCAVCGLEIKNATLPVIHNCESRGLGDTVAKVTKAFGVKPCGKCKQRQAKLNELVPYKRQQ
jgi:hypothetical protein